MLMFCVVTTALIKPQTTQGPLNSTVHTVFRFSFRQFYPNPGIVFGAVCSSRKSEFTLWARLNRSNEACMECALSLLQKTLGSCQVVFVQQHYNLKVAWPLHTLSLSLSVYQAIALSWYRWPSSGTNYSLAHETLRKKSY